MKIKEGKYYRTRRGLIVGPLTRVSWCDRTFAASGITWKENGSYVQGLTHTLDLISEVYVSYNPPSDEPAAPPDTGESHTSKTETKTLRDEFASDWMNGVLANPNHPDGDMESFACMAYRMADAMMEARKK
jgi:hypothetical protein